MEVPQELFDIYNEFADDFINSNFGITCTVNYPIKKEICPNCLYNPQTKRSTNQYKAGGPIPFDTGLCPYCNGLGYKDEQVTENIKLRVYWTRKDWVKLQIPLNIQDGSIQVIGFLTDIPKLKQMIDISINSINNHYMEQKYVLAGDPVPHGFKRDRYFIAYLNRA